MIRVVCVRTGDMYGPEYVTILEDRIARNYSGEYTFECFTDQPDLYGPGIITRLSFGFGGWWDKIGLMQKGLWAEGERIWYFDLDTVITGSLDEIFSYDGSFAAVGDFYKGFSLQSCVMSWRAGTMDGCLPFWSARGRPEIAGGDQAVIQQFVVQWADLRKRYPGSFVSYRLHAIAAPPEGAKIVNFHGVPKPHVVTKGWVPQIWRICGGTAATLVPVGNTEPSIIERNIQHAVTLDKEWVTDVEPALAEGSDVAVIVGGGPSINQQLPMIRALAQHAGDVTVFALNGAAQWCNDNGIVVHNQVMCDPRPEMAAMIAGKTVIYEAPLRIYASQCAPAVTTAAHMLFHAMSDDAEKFVPAGDAGKSDLFVAGGSSVGLIALSLACMAGFRKLHLFGYDSSLSGDQHHAYAQPLNDGQAVIEATLGAVTYKCSPWMAKQAQEYQALAPRLIEAGCEITVHGHGLLPATHAAMCKSTTAADQRADAILKRLNGAPCVGVEVGVFAGDLSVRLLAGKSDLKLFLVDPWCEYEAEGDAHALKPQRMHDAAYEMTKARVETFGKTRSHIMRMSSADAAIGWADGVFDFVFIDANHDYDAVRDDIEAWAPKVRRGGWLCGHDFENVEYPFPGVEQAVREWCNFEGRPFELDDNYTWFVRM